MIGKADTERVIKEYIKEKLTIEITSSRDTVPAPDEITIEVIVRIDGDIVAWDSTIFTDLP